MAVDKAASVVKGGVQAAQQRIDATLGGRIASAIKAQGTTTVGADELKAAPVFDDNSLARAEPVAVKQGIGSRFKQRSAIGQQQLWPKRLIRRYSRNGFRAVPMKSR